MQRRKLARLKGQWRAAAVKNEGTGMRDTKLWPFFSQRAVSVRRFAVLLALLFVSCLIPGSAEPSPQKGPDVVTAGQFVSFLLELNQAPQFDGGRLQVIACPVDALRGNLCRACYETTATGKPRYTLTLQIPGDEDKEELWEASVAFALPNGDFVDLTRRKVTFRVRPKLFFRPDNPLRVAQFHRQ